MDHRLFKSNFLFKLTSCPKSSQSARISAYFHETRIQTFHQDRGQSSLLGHKYCPSLPNQSVCLAKGAWC